MNWGQHGGFLCSLKSHEESSDRSFRVVPVDGFVLVLGKLLKLMTGMNEVIEDWLYVLYQGDIQGQSIFLPHYREGAGMDLAARSQ